MMARYLLRSLAFVILLGACSDPTGVSSDGIRVKVTASSVVIENSRKAPISYIVLDRSTAARALWGPCVWAGCPLVEAGGHVRLPLADFLARRESSELIVYWWHIVPSVNEGFRADSIRNVVVRY